MWDNLLKKMNRQVVPKLAAGLWNADISSIKLVSDGINVIYRFEKDNKGYYLRLTHQKLRSEDEIQSATSFLRHLHTNSVPVCEPILSRNNKWVEQIVDENETYLAHVCREVPGVEITFANNHESLYYNWGKSLGYFHQESKSYKTSNYEYASWSRSLEELDGYIVAEDKSVQKTFETVRDYLMNKRITQDNFGLTHGDHREANVLAKNNHVHFIDFDLPCKNWFLEDFSRPFFNPIVHDENKWLSIFPQYLAGYFSVMPETSLGLNEKSFLRQIQMKALEIYLWTKNNWQGDTAPGGLNTKTWLSNIYKKIVTPSEIEIIVCEALNRGIAR